MARPTNRPTSPHLQIYKLPLTGLISISHRITGVLLAIGLLFFVVMLSALASGQSHYQALQSLLNNGFMQLLYIGFIYALSFHLCHGVRHLIWDIGKTFSRDTLNHSAKLELIASVVLTLALLFFI